MYMPNLINAKFRRLIDLVYQSFQLIGYNNTQRDHQLKSYGMEPANWDRPENLPIILEVAKWLMAEDASNRVQIGELIEFFEPIAKKVREEPDFDIETFTGRNYLNLTTLPDDFYRDLQDQINRAYRANVLPAVQILSRKFLENLIVDILKRKFGFSGGNLELFYDAGNGRFLNFRRLLKNLENKFDEFIGISAGFDRELLRKIKNFKQQANSSAHTLEISITRDTIDGDAEDLEHIIKVLIRVLNSLNQ